MNAITIDGATFFYRPSTTDRMVLDTCVGKDYAGNFNIDTNDKWLDIGAHIGSFTIYAAQKCQHVIAIEPVPSNFELLTKNVQYNGLENKITTINKAVCPANFTLPNINIITNSINMGGCGIYGNTTIGADDGDSISVPVILISEIVKLEFNALKLDAEGIEFDILPELNYNHINKLIVEFHYRVPTASKSTHIKNHLSTIFKHSHSKCARLGDVEILTYWGK